MADKPIRITSKLIFIPPYLSATWSQVKSLRVEGESEDFTLRVTLADGHTVAIPHLDSQTVEQAFAEHARYVETMSDGEEKGAKNQLIEGQVPAGPLQGLLGMPITFDFPATMESMGSVLAHNPEQADSPALPAEVLNRIAAIARAVGGDAQTLPPFEANCNCLYCQIARALQGGTLTHEEEESAAEPVSDDELRFRTWDVEQTGEKVYTVTNPLEAKEQYSVFLGEPIGCTCGLKNCEHVRAVLNT
jgi:hypothetical protein